ncbi:Uma2 family endonuclease [Paractinoplanes maris]|uniref:Uma2 family endonuclease n=1 Tax=Paractinoplanes maris TaxID=1734446 RepID=UPI002020885D|nr:Uma2 family endonuclease [Actinoplanes maris]
MTPLFAPDKPPVSATIFPDGRPMSGDDYLALGVTSPRVELLDGSLLVTPDPTRTHQRIARHLANTFESNADPARLEVDDAVNVQLGPDRMVIPDVVVYAADDRVDDLIIDSAFVVLVCEIHSPSNATTDKVLKKHYYAAAGIPWYLMVDPTARTFALYELAGSVYKENSITKANEVLHLTEPVVVDLDPATLLPD